MKPTWITALSAAAALMGGTAVQAQAMRPPNVVVIIADDVGCAKVGCTSALPGIPLPNIRQIAAEGTEMLTATSTGPVCDPSRVSMLLGNPSQRAPVSIWRNPPRHTGFFPIPTQLTTIAEQFKARGYVTAAIGKYAVLKERPYLPLQNGYDEFYGFLTNGQNYFNANVWRNNKPIGKEPGHLTKAFQREAVAFVERNADRPFFLHLTPSAPHLPYQYTSDQIRRCWSAPKARQPYCAMMVGLDDLVGGVRQALYSHKLMANTIFVYAGDNGFETESQVPSPYRGEKGTPYLAAYRVPLTIAYPAGGVPMGGVYAPPVTLMDIYSTVLNAQVPGHDSVNLMPFLRGTAPGVPHDYLYYAVRSTEGSIASGDGQWKFYYFKSGRTELYNVTLDPGETKNVVKAYPGVASTMFGAFNNWRASL